MSKKYVSIIIIILIVIIGSFVYFSYKQQTQQGVKNISTDEILDTKIEETPTSEIKESPENLNEDPTDCSDCGEGGWQKMNENCSQKIITKDDAKSCLINFSWSSFNENMSTDQIEEGYIEIGSMETSKDPTLKSIKVFIYNQWAIDNSGNLYLLEQLG